MLLWQELQTDLIVISHAPNKVTKNTNIEVTKVNDIAKSHEISRFSEITDRPIFNESRKPFVPEKTEVKAKKAKKKPESKKATEQYFLSATIITPDERVALIKSNKEKKLLHLHEGEKIDDWTLSNIQAQQITLINDSETRIVDLVVKKSNPSSKKRLNNKKARNNRPD